MDLTELITPGQPAVPSQTHYVGKETYELEDGDKIKIKVKPQIRVHEDKFNYISNGSKTVTIRIFIE